jgi:hypothetical protein
MRLKNLSVLLIAILCLAGCTTMVPKENLPFPLTNEEFPDPVKVVSIPLPIIASSPNEGITYGALTAFLLHNNKGEVSTLVAPQINYNENFGTTTTLFATFYPVEDRYWEIALSKSTKVNDDFEFKLRDKTLLDKKLELNAFLFSLTDGSARFFGFQQTSQKSDETNYADNETGFNLSAGYQVFKHVQLVVGERFKDVHIRRGAIGKVPFIRESFDAADVPGIDGFTAHAQKLGLIYSTLDSPTLPTWGGYARASVEASVKRFGSSADYRHYEAEMKAYYPLMEARFISVGRLAYNQTLGDAVPFLERSILGGETSLRGYGRNRFIDSSYFLCNLEERIRLFRWEIFDVNADWEIAPFIDLGAVMERLDKAGVRSFEFNPGIGFRAVVRPNIVGRVDLGVGKDGPAVFVGLGYPF